MKYIFFIAILCHLSFSIESGIYHDIKVYESGIRCENLIENGTLCKKKKFPRIQYTEGEEEKVLIYKDLNSKKTYLLIYIKEEEKSVSIPLKKIDVNLYKGEKYLKLIIDSIDFNDAERKIVKKRVDYSIFIEEKESKSEIAIYFIDELGYLEKNYKWYKNTTEEQEKIILKFLEDGTFNWSQLGV